MIVFSVELLNLSVLKAIFLLLLYTIMPWC